MDKLIMPPLNDLYMQWDEKGGYWFSPNGTQITPQDMMEYAAQLEAELEQLKEDCKPFQAQIDQAKTYKVMTAYDSPLS